MYYAADINKILDFLTPLQRARIFNIGTVQSFHENCNIFTKNNETNKIYILLKGGICLKNNDSEINLDYGIFGAEAACGIQKHLASATTTKNSKILIIDKQNFYDTVSTWNIQKLQKLFLQNFLFIYSKTKTQTFKRDKTQSIEKNNNLFITQVIGWIVSAIFPFIVHFLLKKTSLNDQARAFLSAISVLPVFLIFKLMSEYIATILTIFIIIAGGIVQTKVVLIGFSSSNFIVALSLLAIASLFLNSGIAYRLLLKMLKILKPLAIFDNLLLFYMGNFLLIGIPSFLLRVEMMKSFFNDVLQIRKIKKNSIEEKALAFSAYCGAGLMAQGILSSSMMHFILLGMFWSQYVQEFSWIGWLISAFAPLAVLYFGYIFVLLTVFKKAIFKKNQNHKHQCNSNFIDLEKIILKVGDREIASFLSLTLAIIGLATTQIHNIPPDVLCLFCLIVLLLFHFLDDKNFQTRIRWDFLIYICGISGLAYCANAVGLLDWISTHSAFLKNCTKHSFLVLMGAMILMTLILQLFLSRDMGINILSIVFIPLFQQNDLCPWIAVYIISTAGRMWFFEHQEPEFLVFVKQNTNKEIANSLKKSRLILNGFYLLSLLVGYFYWKWLGIL